LLPIATPAAASPVARHATAAAPVVRARLASNSAKADPSSPAPPPPYLLLDPRRSLESLPLLLALLFAAGMVVVLAHEARRGRRH
jgi:hypothetical protein